MNRFQDREYLLKRVIRCQYAKENDWWTKPVVQLMESQFRNILKKPMQGFLGQGHIKIGDVKREKMWLNKWKKKRSRNG